MNKLNYLLIPAIIILLIGNVFLYSILNKQNSDIKKEISELKQEQISQQASQKESLENLQNLVTFNWKEYQNDKFGFSFKYPEYANVCDDTITHQEREKDVEEMEKVELFLRVSNGNKSDSCMTGDISPMFVIIKKNIDNYKTAAEAFYKEFPDINKPLNNHLEYLKVGKSKAYGGKIVYKSTEPLFTREESYGIIILKNNYIVKISTESYDNIFDSIHLGNKPVFDIFIFSFQFNSSDLLK